MRTRKGIRVCLFWLSLVPGFAQPDRATGKMTFDVAVTDKSGKPVHGLEQQDFTILDNKQPRKILSFRAVEGQTPADGPPVEVILLIDEVNTSFNRVAYERD